MKYDIEYKLVLEYNDANMITLHSRQLFNNDKSATELFISFRWPGGLVCSSCETLAKFYVLADARLKCKSCLRRFRLISGSYFDPLYIPINDIYNLVYLFSLGIPVFKSRKLLPVSMKTAHRAYRIFRESIFINHKSVDHISHPEKLADFKRWPVYSGNYVIGIAEHEGRVSLFPCSLHTAHSIIPLSDESGRVGNLQYSDHWHAFSWFRIKKDFVSVRKTDLSLGARKDPKRGSVIDQFWLYLKNWLHQYPAISKKYFPFYLKEAEFRFNHRDDDIFQVLAALLSSARKE